ncbi:MAG: hypothetical protein NTW03_02720 [Verrucomicrobia bacterium]|nr:hypothetical protein [Verrucomicrobiota bacterium]
MKSVKSVAKDSDLLQIFVHGAGGQLAVAHGQDDGGGAADNVAAGKNCADFAAGRIRDSLVRSPGFSQPDLATVA